MSFKDNSATKYGERDCPLRERIQDGYCWWRQRAANWGCRAPRVNKTEMTLPIWVRAREQTFGKLVSQTRTHWRTTYKRVHNDPILSGRWLRIWGHTHPSKTKNEILYTQKWGGNRHINGLPSAMLAENIKKTNKNMDQPHQVVDTMAHKEHLTTSTRFWWPHIL